MNSRSSQPGKPVQLHEAGCERHLLNTACQCPVIETLEQFDLWLDGDLQELRDRNSGWETTGTNRVWFGRK